MELDDHVNADGRADLVKQVREKINELGITYIYSRILKVQSPHEALETPHHR